MVVKEFPDLMQWLFGDANQTGAVVILLLLILATSVFGLFFGFLVTSFRHGPSEAFYSVAKVVAGAIPDWLHISFRRIFAIAGLSIKEAVRRRVILVAFLIFALSLLFGGWFIGGGENPDRVYINFVMWGTQLLILMLVMLISAFSLPDDIRNKTIYTVVTKPVRTNEIIIGRIAGFAVLGTGLLALMGVISLLFVWRGLSHTHQMSVNENDKVEFRAVDRLETGHRASENALEETTTMIDSGHRHYVEIIEDIRGVNDTPPSESESIISQETRGDKIVYKRLQVTDASGHSHKVAVNGQGDDAQYEFSDAKGFFRARKPKYAQYLIFFDRQGNPKERGFSVGDEWTYLGFIDGGITLSRAEFLFNDFNEDDFSNTGIYPLELKLGVYRSNMGDINTRIRAGLQFESYTGDNEAVLARRFRSELIEFETDEGNIQVKGIPRKIPGQIYGPEGELLESGSYDLFDDYAPNGRLKLTVRCMDNAQYLGMARASVYFRLTDRPYWLNFIRGYCGIWMQMMIVICLGVAFSTFLSSPVTMLGTLCAIIFGFFSESIQKLTLPDVEGGGPVESLYRLIIQKNQSEELPRSFSVDVMEQFDKFFMSMVSAVTQIVPDFSRLDFSDFLTYGYFVDNDRLAVAFLISMAFCAGLTLMGYFCLKTRELAG